MTRCAVFSPRNALLCVLVEVFLGDAGLAVEAPIPVVRRQAGAAPEDFRGWRLWHMSVRGKSRDTLMGYAVSSDVSMVSKSAVLICGSTSVPQWS